jgi:uncharacterized protein (DUF488 family)
VTRLLTIGYEGRALDEVVAMLAHACVDRLIDVRERPSSRRAGFSKTPLGAAVTAAGIEYVHLRAAGNPHRHDDVDLRELLARYRLHLAAAPTVIADVAALVRDRTAALLCYEREPADCHRTILAARVARRLRVRVEPL